jgi:hypothetical protein
MRTKALLTSILLGTLSLAGVASASPIVRDHRQPIAQPARYEARTLPQQTTYGYQISMNGQYAQGYTYGNDPYVEGIARGEWFTMQPCVELQGQKAMTRVDLNGKSLRSIELQATAGGVNVTQVGIQYSDGSHGSLQIGRALDVTHAPNLRLDLGPQGRRGVEAIVLYGQGNASIRVLGA